MSYLRNRENLGGYRSGGVGLYRSSENMEFGGKHMEERKALKGKWKMKWCRRYIYIFKMLPSAISNLKTKQNKKM